MRIFNLHGHDWDRTEDREGWRSKDAWVGQRIGAELIGGSMYELEAGHRLWPYHTHHANEEWMIVIPEARRFAPQTVIRHWEREMSCASRGARTAPTR